MTCAVLMCVQAGRREPQGRMHGREGGGKKNKTKNKTPQHGYVKQRASRRRGNGQEKTGRRETAGGARKKNNSR